LASSKDLLHIRRLNNPTAPLAYLSVVVKLQVIYVLIYVRSTNINIQHTTGRHKYFNPSCSRFRTLFMPLSGTVVFRSNCQKGLEIHHSMSRTKLLTLTIAFAFACHKYYFDFAPNVMIVIHRERFSRRLNKFLFDSQNLQLSCIKWGFEHRCLAGYTADAGTFIACNKN
jgi:hypothetical protein